MTPAVEFLTIGSDACSEVSAAGIDVEVYRQTCADITARLAETKKELTPDPSPSAAVPQLDKGENRRSLLIVAVLGTVGLLVAVFLVIRHRYH